LVEVGALDFDFAGEVGAEEFGDDGGRKGDEGDAVALADVVGREFAGVEVAGVFLGGEPKDLLGRFRQSAEISVGEFAFGAAVGARGAELWGGAIAGRRRASLPTRARCGG
jgi:hypothetical protein